MSHVPSVRRGRTTLTTWPRIAAAGLAAGALAVGLLPANAAQAAPAPVTAAPGDDTGDTVSLSELKVERKVEPVGIDVERPRFSWQIDADGRGVEQHAYQLWVATSAEALEDGDVVWTSGVVSSPDPYDAAYDGPTLDPATDYHWRVEVRTNAGRASADSTFRTGLPTPQDWGESTWIGNGEPGPDQAAPLADASWIWTQEDTRPQAPAEPRAFRRTLTSPEGREARSAEILITGDDSFRLWLNGSLVGETAGAENEWQGVRRYRVDLEAERNVFAVRTTNTAESSGANSPAGLLATIRVRYDDGTTEDVVTDTDWVAAKSVPDGFEAPDFDDSDWANAVVQAAYGSGPWGTGAKPQQAVTPAPLLRKEFEVSGEVADATLYVAAGGYANASLNGEPVDDSVLSPGFTDYDDTVQYAATDVTEALAEGSNALGMELGRGFYGMTGSNVWNWQSPPWHAEPTVRAVLSIDYVDGTSEQVVTDDSWTIHDGPTVFDDLYGGETYQAARTINDFDTSDYDDGDWATATVVDGPAGELVNQRQQPIRVTEELDAVEITEPEDGTYVVKFPRVLAGWVEFTAEGPAGTTIEARYAEKLNEDGTVNQNNNGGFGSGFQTDRFTLAGTGENETWEPRFSYKGFQYIQVTGWPGEDAPPLEAFTAKAVHTDAEETGSFETSSPTVNATHRAVVDTLLNNIHSIPTDTPMFEKNGWTGDAAVGTEMFLMNLDTHELFAKWMRDVNETRDANGAPLVIAPSSDQWGQWGLAQPWHSAYVMIPYWLYQYGGDRQVMTEYYDGIKTYVDLEFDRSNNGVVRENRLGDWVSPEASPAGGNAPEDTRVSGTAYLYTMLDTMQRVADLLGRPRDVAHFGDRAAVVKEGFNRAFLDADAGYYRGQGDRGYRQTHNVLALAFGLTPDQATEASVADSIAADVRARGNTLNTGVLGTKYLLPVLSDHGYADLAYTLALQTAYPSWGFMIENGATSMWEHWAKEARSLGHYFLGTVEDWYYRYVAGIQASPTQGYRRTTIAPVVDDRLDHAAATTATPFGPVSSGWEQTDGGLRIDVEVPVGMTATVRLPVSSPLLAEESGDPLTTSLEGVRSVRPDEDGTEVVVGSGSYSFDVVDDAGAVSGVLAALDDLAARTTTARDAGDLARPQARTVLRAVAGGRAAAVDAVDAVGAGEDTEGARSLVAVLDELDTVDSTLAAAAVPGAVGEGLADAALAARDAVAVAVSELLQVSLEVEADGGKVKPGATTPVALTVGNAGDSTISRVSVGLEGPDRSWTVSPRTLVLAPSLAAGAESSGSLQVSVPATAKRGPTALTGAFEYRFEGAAIRQSLTTEVVVDAPVVVTGHATQPAIASPGGEVDVDVALRNQGTAPATVEVAVELPEGWTQVGPAPTVTLRGGESGSARITVRVPRGIERDATTGELEAQVILEDDVLASANIEVPVQIAPDPSDGAFLDHVDLGDQASEQAHALTASESSGTSNEAGRSRRYAGHLTPFSFFEFDLAVEEGQSFVLRTTETYDRAQTKRYKVYVGEEELVLRTITQGGAGLVNYEVVVPAELVTADTVRVRFENQDDAAYYDPSIADVWALDHQEPADDLTAQTPPEVSGAARLGGNLTATGGTWSADDVELSYQWMRDGLLIPGAASASYRVSAADLGRELSVRVVARREGSWSAWETSAAVTPRTVTSSVALQVRPKRVKRGKPVALVARVRAALPVKGARVRILVNGKQRMQAKIAGTTVQRSLRLGKPGRYRIRVVFAGTTGVDGSRSPVRVVRVRR
ncbi:Bacterial alpha-L-rhamnosidase [Nocardioides sp. BGMRC 2183]|nr:Bacterial alpha-L-rhamnosidase [Nocardioides sp. BGMRC 2183]